MSETQYVDRVKEIEKIVEKQYPVLLNATISSVEQLYIESPNAPMGFVAFHISMNILAALEERGIITFNK